MICYIHQLLTRHYCPDYPLFPQEISDDLIGSWGDLISQRRQSPLEEAQEISYVKYTAPGMLDSDEDKTIITSEFRGIILSSGTTGFRTWEAALHLGTYLSTPEGGHHIGGKNVVELGAGTGFLSMYCLKCLGANSVMVTDRDPTLISNIRDCVVRNNLDSNKVDTAIWEWGNPLTKFGSTSHGTPHSFDVALGADLV
jgi:hypothetical protein